VHDLFEQCPSKPEAAPALHFCLRGEGHEGATGNQEVPRRIGNFAECYFADVDDAFVAVTNVVRLLRLLDKRFKEVCGNQQRKEVAVGNHFALHVVAFRSDLDHM